jgi:DeoR/GlpR family transcriptional regulator of sugar metabolism
MASRKTHRQSKLHARARINQVRALLATQPYVTIADLSQRFGVSEMTVRRDLARLETEDRVRRTHGGAVAAERLVFEFEYGARGRTRRAEKQAIAREARKLVQPGQRIILDAGTTTLELAVLLKDCPNLTVITPSLAVASELQFAPNVSVVLLGGILRPGSPDLTGPVTEHCLQLFAADWAFQGAEGIGLNGDVFNIDVQLGQIDRKMRSIAERSCLLADSSKIGRSALYRNGNLRDFHCFITDRGAPAEFIQGLEAELERVVVAK